jgi:hypothetical protein
MEFFPDWQGDRHFHIAEQSSRASIIDLAVVVDLQSDGRGEDMGSWGKRSGVVGGWFSGLLVILFVAATTGASTVENSDLVCSGLTGSREKSLPKTSFRFSSNRAHVSMPITGKPFNYFDGYLFYHHPNKVSEVVIHLGNRLASLTSLTQTVDFRSICDPEFICNYVLLDDKIVFGRVPNEEREIFAKHLVLSNYSGVRMAGSFWIDQNGVLNITNASGSYRPSVARLRAMGQFITAEIGIQNVRLWEIDKNEKLQPVEFSPN